MPRSIRIVLRDNPDDLRLRYFAAMREVSPELIDKLVHYDPKHAMAFIAIEEASGRMLGVVRLHDDPGGENAEFAIIVRSRLKGHGLGWLLMKHMIAYAKEKGLKTVRGQVLAENQHHAADVRRARLPCHRRSRRTRREAGDAAA